MAKMAIVSLNGTSPGFNSPARQAIKSKNPEIRATANQHQQHNVRELIEQNLPKRCDQHFLLVRWGRIFATAVQLLGVLSPCLRYYQAGLSALSTSKLCQVAAPSGRELADIV